MLVALALLIFSLLGGLVLLGCGNGSGSGTSASAAPSSGSISTGVSRCTTTTYAPNYATEIDPATGKLNQLYHWNQLPVGVYFVPNSYLTPTMKQQTLNGFNWWGQAISSTMLFQEVTSPSDAGVSVNYVASGATGFGATTQYQFDSNHVLIAATITFNMTYLATISDITSVAAHEFGHSLGIGGHSNNLNDIMCSSAVVYYLTELTTRDVNTLITAYCGIPILSTSGGVVTGALVKRAVASTETVTCDFGVPGKQ